MSEQPNKTRLQVDVSADAKRNLRLYAAMTSRTLTEAVEHILTDGLTKGLTHTLSPPHGGWPEGDGQ